MTKEDNKIKKNNKIKKDYKIKKDNKIKENNKIKKDYKGEIIDFIKDLIIIFIVVMTIRSFLFEPFQISGESMADTYYNKEFIIVDKFSYLDIPLIKEGTIHRGDVIVFKPGVNKEKKYYIKRVIGTGGDEIKFENGYVSLKKKGESKFTQLDEKFLNTLNYNNTTIGSNRNRGLFTYNVPEGEYFVMGDNRNHSSDSRVCFYSSCLISPVNPYIKKSQIVGKVWIDLGYFNIMDFSFTNPGSTSFPSTKGIDTTPKWFSSTSTYKY